jgi:hypothetical protein
MTTTSHEAQAVHTTNVFASAAQAAGIAAGSASIAAPTPHTPKQMVARAYEGFLGLPVLVSLAAMWVAGAALLGSCALALYVVGSVLLRAVVGYL